MSSKWRYTAEFLDKHTRNILVTPEGEAFVTLAGSIIVFTFTFLLYFIGVFKRILDGKKDISRCESAFLSIFIIPFYLFTNIFSLFLIKIMIDCHFCIHNNSGEWVVQFYQNLECHSGGHWTLMIFADLAILFLLSFFIFITYSIKGSDLLLNKLNFKKTVKTCGMKKQKSFKGISHKSALNFVLKQNKFKRNSRGIAGSFVFIQFLLMVFSTCFQKDAWWPSLICTILCVWIARSFYMTFPYVITSHNHFPIAILFTQTWQFFRTFLLNVSNSSFLIDLSNFCFYLTPLIFIIAYVASYKKGSQYGKFYSESDDYDLIETDSNKTTPQTLKLQKIVIEKIQKLGLQGIRAKSLRSYAVRSANPLRGITEETIAHGVFSLDNQTGFTNCLLLLTKLWAEDNIYFSRISFFNVNFYYLDLKIIDGTLMSIFQFALMSKVFWYLQHLEMHNFVFFRADFMYMMEVLSTCATLELLDLHHNLLINRTEEESIRSVQLRMELEERYSTRGEIFELSDRDKVFIFLIFLRNFGKLKILTQLDKEETLLNELSKKK